MTNEQKVFDTIEERAYYVQLGGKKVRMYPTSLSDDQYISTIISKFPKDLQNINAITANDIMSLASSKDLAKLVSVPAKSKAWFYPDRLLSTWIRRKRAFYLAYKRSSKMEIRKAVIPLIKEIQLFFYRDCIISLQGQNVLKPTKETEATALGD